MNWVVITILTPLGVGGKERENQSRVESGDGRSTLMALSVCLGLAGTHSDGGPIQVEWSSEQGNMRDVR